MKEEERLIKHKKNDQRHYKLEYEEDYINNIYVFYNKFVIWSGFRYINDTKTTRLFRHILQLRDVFYKIHEGK